MSGGPTWTRHSGPGRRLAPDATREVQGWPDRRSNLERALSPTPAPAAADPTPRLHRCRLSRGWIHSDCRWAEPTRLWHVLILGSAGSDQRLRTAVLPRPDIAWQPAVVDGSGLGTPELEDRWAYISAPPDRSARLGSREPALPAVVHDDPLSADVHRWRVLVVRIERWAVVLSPRWRSSHRHPKLVAPSVQDFAIAAQKRAQGWGLNDPPEPPIQTCRVRVVGWALGPSR